MQVAVRAGGVGSSPASRERSDSSDEMTGLLRSGPKTIDTEGRGPRAKLRRRPPTIIFGLLPESKKNLRELP